MAGFDYHDRCFAGVVNYDDGDLTGDTSFHYRQQGAVVWGTFEGGGVQYGTLVARVTGEGILDMVWHYLNRQNEFVGGTCRSEPEILPDGRYRLHESWEVTQGGNFSGKSVIEELPLDV